MITFFTMVRPFVGEFDKLQRMAIGSWLQAVLGCQVNVIGVRNPASIAQACADLSIGYLPNVATNAQGTELVNDAFRLGELCACHDLVCAISADIVLGADIALALPAIKGIEHPFVVGQRWDIDPGASKESAKLHPPCGIDYFIFRKGTLGEIPPFAVGRMAYDNWLVWAAMERWDLQVIDATEAITAIHVNHGYPEYGDKAAMLVSEEREENHRLCRESGCPRWYGIKDAPYVLSRGRVRERAHA